MRMSLSTNERSNQPYREMPSYVKIIILAQAATILSLTVWMYQVYLNDLYFRQYIISLLRTSIIADALLSLVTVSVFALGTFTLLGSMSTTRKQRKEWDLLSEQGKAPYMPSLPVLEAVEPPSTPRSRSRRPRSRKPRADTAKIFDSMLYFADDSREQ